MQYCLSLEDLSRQCGYSASRLRKLFEQEYGQSPQSYRSPNCSLSQPVSPAMFHETDHLKGIGMHDHQ